MRFRFSIRDLLWLMLVVAMGLGWWINHEHWMGAVASLGRSLDRAKAWRTRTGALEEALKNESWEVTWDLPSSKVNLLYIGRPGEPFGQVVVRSYPTDSHEPSANDE